MSEREKSVERKNVLLAETAELWLVLEKSFFRREGFTLRVASRGGQALRIIEEQHPALAILQLEMPEIKGDEVCRRIKDQPKLQAIPIILLPPTGAETELERCRRAGCDDILRPPLSSWEILVSVCRLLKIPNRTVPRIDTRLPVFCSTEQGQKTGRVLNLSTGGAFIEMDRPFAVGTRVSLEFALPNQLGSLRPSALVTWVNQPLKKPALPVGFGVQFQEMPSATSAELASFVQDHLRPASHE